MQYAGIIKNDIAAGKKVNVSFFVQGCPFHCAGCHNPETWDFNGGKEFTDETLQTIINSISANDVQRNFSLMGGEPLCEGNLFLSYLIISTVREKYPNIEIYVWSGYTLEELLNRANSEERLKRILQMSNYLIDGPFILEERDITLPMRGSRNQRIINLKEELKGI